MLTNDNNSSSENAKPRALCTSWLAFNDPQLALYQAREAVDAVTLDAQHGQFDYTSIVASIANIRLAGKSPIVRVPVGDFSLASRVLDAGAEAIIAPMIDDAAEARRLVEFCKYQPIGNRSWGPYLACAVTEEEPEAYRLRANASCLVIPMIESARAVDRLEEILDVAGVDGVFIGPADLSLSLSEGRDLNPLRADVVSSQKDILRICRSRGKRAWAMSVSPQNAKYLSELGFDLIALGMDVFHLQSGTRSWLAELNNCVPQALGYGR
ncbi:HpcH/HpaI aldolase family protein [Rhizobium tubonense]|uniref:Rhodanese domain-containing protein n=1 Tax=Rhizobium tubonense TaxID=484088 RepID=A0A2W4EP02_9HYPH|nr:aldolase/citrate lyase family protein [Rhizobium tubonense]PZM12953.1 hypothetical protein CPY51_15590 [Rhizobium tubonense]